MLALKVLVRSRLRVAGAKCATVTANAVGSNAAAVDACRSLLKAPNLRRFVTMDGPKDEEEEEDKMKPLNGEQTGLNRLLQHAHEFRLDVDDDDVEQDDDDEGEGDDDQSFPSSWQSNDTTRARSNRPTRSRDAWQARAAKRATENVQSKEVEDLDFSELEVVWGEKRRRERKFHQALRREQDKNQVCTNCGERGHRKRNCLVPQICANCGNLGHSSAACKFPRMPQTVDEFLEQEKEVEAKKKKTKKLQQRWEKAAKDPLMDRPAGLPVTDFTKRNEQLRQEMDSELEEYVERYERIAAKRKEKKDEDA